MTERPSRHFFLNERHELSRDQKSGGGGVPKYTGIDWAQKGKSISSSIQKARERYSKTADPVSKSHYYLVALPDTKLKKVSEAKGKKVEFEEPADFKSNYTQAFHRVGMDLLRVDSKGRALVHVKPERLDAVEAISSNLTKVGVREQARWAPVQSFEMIELSDKLDESWLKTQFAKGAEEVILELQPLLVAVEVDAVMGGVVQFLSRANREKIEGSGQDYSGRHWLRTRLSRETVRRLAEQFPSIQSLHSPLATPTQSILSGWTEANSSLTNLSDPELATLPSVGILDTGVPDGHLLLAPYRRNRYVDPRSIGTVEGDHGSTVASKIVFGHCNPTSAEGLLTANRCRFVDVVVTRDAQHIEDKAVVPAIDACTKNFPDVRVYNLSFGDRLPLEQFPEQEQLEKLAQIRDLDNLIFNEDVLVVVAASNSPQNVLPNPAYPESYRDPLWRIPTWARGFNSIVCGSLVGEVRSAGLAKTVGWPSPFSRVGPGMAGSPIPGFAEHGGDTDAEFRRGYGVAVCDRSGRWFETCGTSYAAPLLARKAAHLFEQLQKYCQGNTRPYAALVKAFMATTAALPESATAPAIAPLSERALGRGEVNADLLLNPAANRAIFFWQGVLESAQEIVRIQVPVPKAWVEKAQNPSLRILWSWESPVHDAASEVWACRRVNLSVRPGPEARAVTGRAGNFSHPSYTLREKYVTLKKIEPVGDFWLLEASYEELADYFPGREYSPKQRVGVVIELEDLGGRAAPQQFVQALSVAPTYDRLAIPPAKIPQPTPIKV